MKLYCYSVKSLLIVDSKWSRARLVACGFVLGVAIFFGFMEINHAAKTGLAVRSTRTLPAENNVMWQQVDMTSLRVSRLEMQATQSTEHANRLRTLLHRHSTVVDTVHGFADVATGTRF